MLIGAKFDHGHVRNALLEIRWMQKQIGWQCVFYVWIESVVNAHRFFVFRLEGVQCLVIRSEPNSCGISNKIDETHVFFAHQTALNVGNDVKKFMFLDRQLCAGIKRADAFYVVAKKLNPKGLIVGIGKDVDNSPTNGKLSRFVDKFHPFKIQFKQRFVDEINRIVFANFEFECAFRQVALRWNSLK